MDTSEHKPTTKEIKEWDKNELLEWIQQQRPKPLDGDILEKFKAADIPGKIFLKHAGDAEFFEKKCNLSIGPSEILADLAAEIVGMEAVGVKRYREQAGDAEISDTASKKPRLESEPDGELQELAASACQQRKRIQQEIEKLDQSFVSSSKEVVPYPNSVFQLSNPTFDTKLPFPFVGQTVPGRFRVNGKDDERNWFYMGREKFTELRERFEHLRSDIRLSTLIIYGTRGYGKSHLLAALVCYLAAQEEKVVYIPDCREFMKQPVPYIIAAILFAWADDNSKQQMIMTLDTQEKIHQFFKRQKKVVFVIDQVNAFQTGENDKEYTANKKARLHEWLQDLMAPHKAVLSSSANNHSILNEAQKQSSNDVMNVYGGLTRKEMDYWWARRQEVKLGDYTKYEVEDFTGCIPLFLEKCVVDGTINLATKFFIEIDSQAWAFEQDIRAKYKRDPENLGRHYQYMKCCLLRLPVRPSSQHIPALVDHRYFYDDYDPEYKKLVGNYTCGICRNAAALTLLENKMRFDRELMQLLPNYVSNPCVTGFIIEQAILSSIVLEGLNITPELNRPMEVAFFQADFPSFNTTTNGPVLYIPKVFNYRNIDGIIVRIAPKPRGKKTKQELFMYPLQITLAPDKHSNSRKKFFAEWKTWTKGLEEFAVVPEFVWISPEAAETKEHVKDTQQPDHVERYVPIRDVSMEIWNWYDEGKQNERIAHY